MELARLRPYTVPIILGFVSIVAIVCSVILIVRSTQTTTPIQFSDDQEASPSAVETGTIVVDVEGAVVRPGVYSIAAGSRVADAISAAGGLAETADTDQFSKTVNRAMKLTDGAKLYVPKTGEALQENTSYTGSSQQTGLVSVNTASESELDALPGVGPATAAKIIANRPYQTLEELVSKKALGPALFEKLKNNLSL